MLKLSNQRNAYKSIVNSKFKRYPNQFALKRIKELLLITTFAALTFTGWVSIYNTTQFQQNAFADVSNRPPPPLQQFQLGIPAKYIDCMVGLQLIIKSTGTPACLKWENGKKLLERGWAESAPMISNSICDSECKQKLESQSYTCYEAAKDRHFCTEKLSQRTSGIVIPYSASSPDGKNYIPNSIMVSIGINNTVQWTNVDEATHRIVGDEEEFSSPLILPNQSWTFTFDKVGKYGYHGERGPWLHGTVIVLPVSMEFDKGKPIENWGGEPFLGRYLFRETDSLGYVDKLSVLDNKSIIVSLFYPKGVEERKIKLGDEFIGTCSKYNEFTTVRTLVLERIDVEQKIAQFREEIEQTKKNCNEILIDNQFDR